MPPTDTSPSARLIHESRMAELTPAERVRIGVDLWRAAWSLQRAAILHRNPAADEAEIAFQIAVSRFGPELARAAFRRN